MNLTEIQTAINAWNNIRTSGSESTQEEVINYLKQGFCFEVNWEEYNVWNTMPTPPEFIHAYIGVVDEALVFFLIDSVSDANMNFDNILIKDYMKGSSVILAPISNSKPSFKKDINESENLKALEECFHWQLYCKTWANNVLSDGTREILQLMMIPFADFTIAFDNNPLNLAASYFALQYNTEEGYYDIDLYTSAIDEIPSLNRPSDRCRPVPPFDPEMEPTTDFKLYFSSIS